MLEGFIKEASFKSRFKRIINLYVAQGNWKCIPETWGTDPEGSIP
jgi:hypothetical protein